MSYAPDSQQVFSQPKIPPSCYEVRSYSGDSSPIPVVHLTNVKIRAEDISFMRRGIIFVRDSSLESKFKRLADEWKQDTAKLSMVQKKVLHPSYQQIIGMGKDALPLIFKELEREPDDWLWALTAITGRDDVAKIGSTLDEATKEWLAWAKSNRYLTRRENGGARYTVGPS